MYPECDKIENIDRHLTYWHNLMIKSLDQIERYAFKLEVPVGLVVKSQGPPHFLVNPCKDKSLTFVV